MKEKKVKLILWFNITTNILKILQMISSQLKFSDTYVDDN